VLLTPRTTGAVEIPLPGQRSMRLGITQSLKTEYISDDNELPDDPFDAYGRFKNQTDLVLMHGTTSFNLRFDFDTFVGGYDPKVLQATYGLEKINLSSIQKTFEITAGDFYARIGRGLALDLTREDDLYRDTTLRGIKLKVDTPWVSGQVFGGWVNPLEADGASGAPMWIPSDVIGGGRVVIRPHKAVALGVHYTGAGIESRQYKMRNATHIIGGSVEFPSLWEMLSVYAEYNLINRVGDTTVETGHATYLSVTGNMGGLALLAEFKYYRRFELKNPADETAYIYHRPPTLMYKKQEVINNHDTIGPRLRLDYRIASWGSNLWASYGHFFRSDAAVGASFFDTGAAINDVFGGLQQQLSGGALDITGGYRKDTLDQNGKSITDFSHIFVEADLATRIFAQHTLTFDVQYNKIEKAAQQHWALHLTLGYQPSKYFSGAVLYEYTTEFSNMTDAARKHFGGVTATAYATPSTYARLFVGSTSGGLRCIDGQCKTFPSFQGGRLELVAQF
jgi:hypothetical protein